MNTGTVIATQTITNAVGKTGETLIWINFIIRLFFSQAMAEVIGMLGFMQLVVYYPLLAVKFPPTANILYKQLTSIVTFDLIPTDDFYP